MHLPIPSRSHGAGQESQHLSFALTKGMPLSTALKLLKPKNKIKNKENMRTFNYLSDNLINHFIKRNVYEYISKYNAQTFRVYNSTIYAFQKLKTATTFFIFLY